MASGLDWPTRTSLCSHLLAAWSPRPPLLTTLPHFPLPVQAGLPERSKLLAVKWAALSKEAKQPFVDHAQVGGLAGWASRELVGGGRQEEESWGAWQTRRRAATLPNHSVLPRSTHAIPRS